MGDITVILVIFSDKLVLFLGISEYTHTCNHIQKIYMGYTKVINELRKMKENRKKCKIVGNDGYTEVMR